MRSSFRIRAVPVTAAALLLLAAPVSGCGSNEAAEPAAAGAAHSHPDSPGPAQGEAFPPDATHTGVAVQRAYAALETGDAETAVGFFTTALRQAPGRADLLASRSNAWTMLQRWEQALADIEKAVRLEPENAAYLSNRAQLYKRFGRADAALDDLRRAVELDPTLQAARFNLGVMRFETGALAEALKDFEACIAMDAHAAPPWFNRALTHDAMGNRDAARADLERFMERTESPENRKVAEELLASWKQP